MRGKTIACLGQSVTAAHYFVQRLEVVGSM